MTDVPQLTTALHQPLHFIEQQLLQHKDTIEHWLLQQWRHANAPLYCSVDIRNAGFKLAAVDTNLFPGGFNNLNPEFYPRTITAITTYFQQHYPTCQRILLLPESHTRHVFYYQNIATLQELLSACGFEVRVGSLLDAVQNAQEVNLPDGWVVRLEPIQLVNGKLIIDNFLADVIVLNNDLSDGVPTILEQCTQPIIPHPKLGWATRHKSTHFAHAETINANLCRLLGLDDWLLNPIYRVCDDVSFVDREGEACLLENIYAVLQQIQKKYDEYGLTQEPFVIVKADSGTYGMGIMTVRDVEQIKQLNRKERSKMSALKGQRKLSRVILQEGVPSIETWQDERAVAEPVIYMVGQQVVGGFYRVHSGRGIDENLNAPGMQFEQLRYATNADDNQRFYSYSVIARLALLAAGQEMKIIDS